MEMEIIAIPTTALIVKDDAITGFDDSLLDSNKFWSLIIPTSIDGTIIKGIGKSAFCGTKNLVEVHLEYDSRLEYIDEGAFAGCSNLSVIDINRQFLCSMGDSVFFRCGEFLMDKPTSPTIISLSKLLKKTYGTASFLNIDLRQTKIPKIRNHCFSNSAVKTVYLPQTVKSIGVSAFDSSDVEYINFEDIPIEKIESSAFKYSSIKSISSLDLEDVELSEFAFYGCSKLTSCEIPESTILNNDVFHGCENLKKVIFYGKRKAINQRMFYECKNLRAVNLPDGLEVIFHAAFAYTESLKKITYPETLTTVENDAFARSGIVEFLPQTISKIVNINKEAFASCGNLRKIDINSEYLTHIGTAAFQDTTNLKDINLDKSNITCFNDYVFFGSGLTTIKLPSSLSYIGVGVFFRTAISSMDLSTTNVTELSCDCFANCEKLKSVKLPYFIGRVSEEAFSSTKLNVEEIVKDYPFVEIF